MADLTITSSAGPLRAAQLGRATATAVAGTAVPAPGTTAASQSAGASTARATTMVTFAGGLSQSTLLAAQSGGGGGNGGGGSSAAGALSEEEQAVVAEMKQTDAKVRAHEMAHLAAGGQFASGPTYEYQKGPDGGMYVVAGEVQIDTSPVPGDPQATIAKAQQVRAAALAPGDPSAQDRKVAAAAAQMAAQASAELGKQDEDGTRSDAVGPREEDSQQDDPAARSAAQRYDAVSAMVAAVQQQAVNLAA